MIDLNFTTQHLFIIVLSLIAGIAFPCSLLWATILLATALVLALQEYNKLIMTGLVCCFLFFGSTRYYQHTNLYFEHQRLLEKNCNITGAIQEILPRLEEKEQICILLKISHVEINEASYPIHKKIYLFLPWYTKLWVKPHQEITLKNVMLKHPRSISYQTYLIKENIWATAHQKQFAYTTVKKPSLLRQHFDQLCALPLQTTTHTWSQLTQSLYLSIFCGKKIKSQATTNIKALFQYWGISHHLARSGLHLVILISLLLFLLSYIPCSGFHKQWITVGILCVYYAMTYPSVAFLRAFYMYILYTLCKQLYLPSNPIHILLITTLLILTANPYQLFFLDFQLSFSITLLILWFCRMTQNTKTIAS